MREVRVWVYKDGTWSHYCCHWRQRHDTFLVLLMIPCDKFILSPCKRGLWSDAPFLSQQQMSLHSFFLSVYSRKDANTAAAKWLNRPHRGIMFCVYVPPCAQFVANSGRPQPKLWRRSTAAGCSVTFRPLKSKLSMSFTQKATVDTPGGVWMCVCLFCYLVFSYGQLPVEGWSSREGGEWLGYHCLHWMGAKRALCFSHMAIINGAEWDRKREGVRLDA